MDNLIETIENFIENYFRLTPMYKFLRLKTVTISFHKRLRALGLQTPDLVEALQARGYYIFINNRDANHIVRRDLIDTFRSSLGDKTDMEKAQLTHSYCITLALENEYIQPGVAGKTPKRSSTEPLNRQ